MRLLQELLRSVRVVCVAITKLLEAGRHGEAILKRGLHFLPNKLLLQEVLRLNVIFVVAGVLRWLANLAHCAALELVHLLVGESVRATSLHDYSARFLVWHHWHLVRDESILYRVCQVV